MRLNLAFISLALCAFQNYILIKPFHSVCKILTQYIYTSSILTFARDLVLSLSLLQLSFAIVLTMPLPSPIPNHLSQIPLASHPCAT